MFYNDMERRMGERYPNTHSCLEAMLLATCTLVGGRHTVRVIQYESYSTSIATLWWAGRVDGKMTAAPPPVHAC